MSFLHRFLALVTFASPLSLCLPAHAATLCVSNDGSYPCFARISDAVAAAAPGDVIRVGFGTYYDSVTITKSISLVSETAVLDAGGQKRGFFVNGINSRGLYGVNISGFTVRNAQFEGILVANASAVTISNNTLYGNDRGLVNGQCPGLDDFESGGQADCGQAIHLLGSDHSVVTNNVVQGNAGGILLSDDSAAVHDNVVSLNTVSGNPYASGIQLSSNRASVQNQRLGPISGGAADTGPQLTENISFGVYHNTIYGNRSRGNGAANNQGAGVALLATIDGASLYGNVIVGNLLAENAQPGVVLHAPDDDEALNDNQIMNNTLISNAADSGITSTSGPTGISLYAPSGTNGNMLIGNQVQNEAIDVAINQPSAVQVSFNALQGSGFGVVNLGTGSILAPENFWSCSNGPTIPFACSSVSGVSVQYDPWLTQQLPTQPVF